jgi:hypothetical protein
MGEFMKKVMVFLMGIVMAGVGGYSWAEGLSHSLGQPSTKMQHHKTRKKVHKSGTMETGAGLSAANSGQIQSNLKSQAVDHKEKVTKTGGGPGDSTISPDKTGGMSKSSDAEGGYIRQ